MAEGSQDAVFVSGNDVTVNPAHAHDRFAFMHSDGCVAEVY